MDKSKRNSGITKIIIAILLWSLFPIYKVMFGLTYKVIDDPIIGILRFWAFLVGFILLIYGMIQIGKSRNLQNKPSLSPEMLERKSKWGVMQIFLSLFVAIIVFAVGMITDFEESPNVLSTIWMTSIFTSMSGLVSLKRGGLQKTIYLLFIMSAYGGMIVWGFIYAFRNWQW